MNEPDRHILALAAQIVTAQLRNDGVKSSDIPNLITSVYNALRELHHDGHAAPTSVGQTRGRPDGHQDHGVQISARHQHQHNGHVHPLYGQTVFDDHLICMEDGLRMKMLKRHLHTVHGMTPDEYRAKWKLPADYPMVAQNYAKLRSNLALDSGLGLKPQARAGLRRKGR